MKAVTQLASSGFMHMALSNLHIMKHSFTIHVEGYHHPCEGKVLCREVHTPKHKGGSFGKAEVIFYLQDSVKAEQFHTAQALFDHYKLPPLAAGTEKKE